MGKSNLGLIAVVGAAAVGLFAVYEIFKGGGNAQSATQSGGGASGTSTVSPQENPNQTSTQMTPQTGGTVSQPSTTSPSSSTGGFSLGLGASISTGGDFDYAPTSINENSIDQTYNTVDETTNTNTSVYAPVNSQTTNTTTNTTATTKNTNTDYSTSGAFSGLNTGSTVSSGLLSNTGSTTKNTTANESLLGSVISGLEGDLGINTSSAPEAAATTHAAPETIAKATAGLVAVKKL